MNRKTLQTARRFWLQHVDCNSEDEIIFAAMADFAATQVKLGVQVERKRIAAIVRKRHLEDENQKFYPLACWDCAFIEKLEKENE